MLAGLDEEKNESFDVDHLIALLSDFNLEAEKNEEDPEKKLQRKQEEILKKMNKMEQYDLKKEPEKIDKFVEQIAKFQRILETRIGKLLKSDPKGQYEPAFFARSPTTIKFASQPLIVSNEITEIDTKIFAQTNNFQWTDSILLPKTERMRDHVWEDTGFAKISDSAIEERLHHPLNCLVVGEMGENIGKGVFLALDAKPLPIGTIIGVYAARLGPPSEGELQHYDYIISENLHYGSPVTKSYHFKTSYFKAGEEGNITRFIQDLPLKQEIDKIKNLNTLQMSNIATANLLALEYLYNGYPVVALMTTRDINPGEHLGFPYGWNWSSMGIQRAVFDVYGRIIGRFQNEETIELKEDFKPLAELAAPTIQPEKVRTILMAGLSSDLDHEIRFCEDINFCLEIFANRPQSVEAANYVMQLQKIFDTHKINADELKKELLLKLKKSPPPESLKVMANEIYIHIKKYVEAVVKKVQQSSWMPSYELKKENEKKKEKKALQKNTEHLPLNKKSKRKRRRGKKELC